MRIHRIGQKRTVRVRRFIVKVDFLVQSLTKTSIIGALNFNRFIDEILYTK